MHKILAAALLIGTIVIGATMLSSQPKANDIEEIPQVTSAEGEECDFFKGDIDCPVTDEQDQILNEPHFIGSEEATRIMKIKVPEDSLFKANW